VVSGWVGVGDGRWRPDTMALRIGSFAIEIHLTALNIRAGSYDLLWDRNGLCICKGNGDAVG
jgi:hypothetical protein